jgi:hypothetical protein
MKSKGAQGWCFHRYLDIGAQVNLLFEDKMNG